MSFANLAARLRLSPRDAEVIFDRDEPVGQPTDLVMPARRWFGRGQASRIETRSSRRQVAHAPDDERHGAH